MPSIRQHLTVQNLLRVTLLCALASSWAHLEAVFSLLYGGVQLLGWDVPMGAVCATAVDGSMFALSLALGRAAALEGNALAEDGERLPGRLRLYGGLLALLGISALFNLDSALTHLAGDRPLAGRETFGVDWLDIARAGFGAMTLPLMVAYLTHGLAGLESLTSVPLRESPSGEVPVASPLSAGVPPQPLRRRPRITGRAPYRPSPVNLSSADLEEAQRWHEARLRAGSDDDDAVAVELAKLGRGKSARTARRGRAKWTLATAHGLLPSRRDHEGSGSLELGSAAV